MTEKLELPAVHLSIDDLEQIEELLREHTTNCKIEIILSRHGGVEKKFQSVSQIDRTILAETGGSNSYSLSATGDEGQCTIGGESMDTESHMLYYVGDSGWENQVRHDLKEYINSVQNIKSRLRGQLTGKIATGIAVLAALFVGWAMTAVAPQSVVHYFPTLFDAFVFSIGIFGLLIVRFRNWAHPYVWVGHDRSYPTKLRIGKLGIVAILLTFVILTSRWGIEPGPFLG